MNITSFPSVPSPPHHIDLAAEICLLCEARLTSDVCSKCGAYFCVRCGTSVLSTRGDGIFCDEHAATER